MDPAVKRGFLIGFLIVAVILGFFAWRDGWIDGAAPQRADAPRPPIVELTPSVPGKPKGDRESGPAGPAAKAPETAPAPGASTAAPAPGAAPAAGQPGSARADGPARPNVEKGAFDVVRVEPGGDMVVAGRCPANCTAELTANGKVQDKATADAGGHFAMTPPALAPGDYQIGLKVTTPDGKVATSEQSLTVSVPQPPSKDVVVVLNAPDAPSKILQRPGEAVAAASPAPNAGAPSGAGAAGAAGASPKAAPERSAAALSLGAVDAENGRFFVQGTAPAGARLRVYLNNAPVAEPVAGPDGRWSLRVERGLSPGSYAARVDQLDGAGKVTARSEARFAYEAEVAAAPSKPEAGKPSAQQAPKQDGPAGSAGVATSGALAQSPSGGDGARDVASAPAAGGAASPSAASGQGAAGGATSSSGSTGGAAPAPSVADAGSAATPRGPETPQPSPTETAAAAPSGAAPVADPANPVIESIDTAQVKRGDTLWRISRAIYGHGRRYTVIFTANDQQIRNPNLIYPGQVLVLPAGRADSAEARSR